MRAGIALGRWPRAGRWCGRDTGTAGTHILLATGGAPAELPICPLTERIISSTEALTLERVPERMVVIGAGAIGLEMGSVGSTRCRGIGRQFMEHILPGMDTEMAGQLQRLLKRQGGFRLKRSQGLCVKKKAVQLQLESKGNADAVECDVVLVAVGRRPFTGGLGLENADVQIDERGRVQVDAQWRTTAEGVWAVGYLMAGTMLAHKAEAEGVAAVERMAGKADWSMPMQFRRCLYASRTGERGADRRG